jgi:hypothetical protein
LRRAALIAAAAALVFAQALLRPAPLPGAAAAESSLSVLAGAARPVVVALAWAEAEAALEDRRVVDALDRLRVLERADPASWEASAFRAHLIGHNLADREEGRDRADRIVEALRVLEAASLRTADPGPDVAKGRLLMERRMREPELRAALARALKATPTAAALASFESAARKAPSDRILRLQMEAARLAGLELLLSARRADDALPKLDLAASLAAKTGEATLGRELASAWAAAGRAAIVGDGGAIDSAASELVLVLSRWAALESRIDDEEAVFAATFARRAVALAEGRAASGDARAALSLLEAVHRIRGSVEASLDRAHRDLLPAAAERRRAEALLDQIAAKDPDSSGRVARLRSAISAW